MSTTVMAACWSLKMSVAQKAVLISLADNANDHGECWPSIETICERTCLTDRAVQKSIKALVEMGFLLTEYRRGHSTKFTITPERRSPPNDVHPRTTFTTVPNVVHPTPERRSPRTVKAINQDQKKDQKPPPAAPAALIPDPPDWVDRDAWDGFVAMRKRERHPLTARAATLVLAELERLRQHGHDPTAVLDQSVMHGWRGVFPIREESGHANRSTSRNPSVAERSESALRARHGIPQDAEIDWLATIRGTA